MPIQTCVYIRKAAYKNAAAIGRIRTVAANTDTLRFYISLGSLCELTPFKPYISFILDFGVSGYS
jgi:hypothetical protein